jgi:hypothetical protein
MADIANPNFLSQFGYKAIISRIPHLEYFQQSLEIPGLNLGTASIPTPFTRIPFPGNITYQPLTLRFKVDENLENWKALFDWMLALGNAKDFQGYRNLANVENGSKFTLTSDITISILKSSMNPNKKFVFKDAFPVNVGDLSFNTIDTDINYIESSVTFQYTYYELG